MSPNSATLEMPRATVSTSTGACLHCGQAASGKFCCPGCRQVYEYLAGEGLTHYYDLMIGMGRAATSQSIAKAHLEGKAIADSFRYRGSAKTFAFFVPSLSCAACLWLIERVLVPGDPTLPGVASVRVNLDDRLVLVGVREDEERAVPAVISRLAAIGYKAMPPRLAGQAGAMSPVQRKNLQNLGIAGAVFGNVMLFAAAVYFGDLWGMSPAMRRFFDWFSFALTLLTLATAGRSFFATAWSTARRRILHVDLPIAVALALSFGVSAASLVRGQGPVYFDSVAGLIFLLLAGRYWNESLQARARRLAGSAAALVPDSAAALRPGDVVAVAPGEVVPADGQVVAGRSEVDEAALSGEQKPVLKRAGDPVSAGTQNLNGALSIKVLRPSSDSYVARITRLVEEAGGKKSRFETLAALWLPKFVLGIFVAATASFCLWWPVDHARALAVVTATLIVSCPCALALATPLTMAISLRRSWRRGAIVKSGTSLEVGAKVDAIVLDKTGTVTVGNVRVVGELVRLTSMERRVVGAAAARSRHPVARAVARHFEADAASVEVVAAEIHEDPGRGLEAQVRADGRVFVVRIGTPAFVGLDSRAHRADGAGIVAVSVSEAPGVTATTILYLEDRVHVGVSEAVAAWRDRGIDVYLLSGDAPGPVSLVAKAVGIPDGRALASQSPADKRRFVEDLQRKGRTVMMVGDGINDAAALSAAALGVAVSGGVDLALNSADVFLGSPGIEEIAGFLRFCAYTRRTLVLILTISVLYNLAAIGLAMAGILHPLVAAMIMPLASLTVVSIGALRRGEDTWKCSTSSCR